MALSDVFLLFRDSFYCNLSSLANRAQLKYVSVYDTVILYYKQGVIFAASGF